VWPNYYIHSYNRVTLCCDDQSWPKVQLCLSFWSTGQPLKSPSLTKCGQITTLGHTNRITLDWIAQVWLQFWTIYESVPTEGAAKCELLFNQPASQVCLVQQSVTKLLHLFLQTGSHFVVLFKSGFNVESIMIRSYPKLQQSVSCCSMDQPLKRVLRYKVWSNYNIFLTNRVTLCCTVQVFLQC
jgi:hypothetical protein